MTEEITLEQALKEREEWEANHNAKGHGYHNEVVPSSSGTHLVTKITCACGKKFVVNVVER